MKKIYFIVCFCAFTFFKAQVGVNTVTPAAGSILDVDSSDKGILIPRINITNLGNISPVTGGTPTGLIVYNTNATTGVGLHYWNGTRWVAAGSERAWSLTGNADTTSSNFIGTTDSQPLRIRTNNTQRFEITTDGHLRASADGTATLPVYSWNDDTNMGIYRIAADQLGFSTNGTLRFIIPNANQVHANSRGTAALPFYSFAADTNTGLWSPDADVLAMSTNGAERMRINSDGRTLINTTTLVTGDILRVVAGAGESAVNGYASTGIGVYGEATNGIGTWGIATGTGDGVWADASTGHGIWASATSGIAVRGDATSGVGVRGSASGTDATGVYGFANTGTQAWGVWGSSSSGNGVVGSSTAATGLGGRFSNSNTSGTGVIISGQNATGLSFTTGGGGSIVGNSSGLLAVGRTAASGWGVLATGNNITSASSLAEGGGGAFTGRQWGVYANANISGNSNNSTDRAAFVGNFISAGTTAATVYVGARIGGNVYKILGGGGASGASVSTYMPTRDGQRILFAPESPENWFFDIGEAKLVNGKATVEIDPIFVDCISEEVPFKVFVQGAEDIIGSIVVKRNQNAKTFELTDTGGNSNGIVQYKIYGIWKGKENLRLPKYEQPFEFQELKMEETNRDFASKIRNSNNDISSKDNDIRMKVKKSSEK